MSKVSLQVMLGLHVSSLLTPRELLPLGSSGGLRNPSGTALTLDPDAGSNASVHSYLHERQMMKAHRKYGH